MNTYQCIFRFFLISSFLCPALLAGQSYRNDLVEIGAGFYVDAEETSNRDWQEYLSWIKDREGVDSPAYQAAHPDTSVWLELKKGAYLDPLVSNYFSHPAYQGYPVVGITYDQAKAYCQWRTERIRALAGPSANEELVFRLPSLAEWYLIRRFNHPDLHYQVKKKDQGLPIFNTQRPKRDYLGMNTKAKQLPLTSPVRSYLASEAGVYNLHGNVAEMTDQQGVAVGGSFFHAKKVIDTGEPQSYTKPTAWLGCRCIAIEAKQP